MGNQQLILVVLGTIIVCVAVSVGVVELRSYHDEAVADNIQSHLLGLARDAVVYFQKPKALGGGDRSWADYRVSKKFRDSEDVAVRVWTSQTTISFRAVAPFRDDKLELYMMIDQAGKYLIKWVGEGNFTDRTTEWTPLL